MLFARLKALKNSTLSELDLFFRDIGDTGALQMAEALEGNSTLERFGLSCCRVTDEGATALAKSLNNSVLEHLDLSGNKLGNKCCVEFGHALEENSTLVSLWLSLGITDEGATALVEALTRNSTLKMLELGYNKITEVGASALAKALESSVLTNLDLSVVIKLAMRVLLHLHKHWKGIQQ